MKQQKKLAVVMVLLLVTMLFSACDKEKTMIEDEAKQKVEGDLMAISEAFSRSVDGMDLRDTLKDLLDPDKPELLVEYSRRLKDLKQMGGEELMFQVQGMEDGAAQKGSDTVKVKIYETYRVDGKKNLLIYWAEFRMSENGARYSDLVFQEKREGNIILYYSPGLEPIADRVFQSIRAAYEKVGAILPGRPTRVVVKAYDDSGLFASFIKPSIGFDMAGWNEAGEAVKLNFGLQDWRGMGEAVMKNYLEHTLAHEITHLISGEMSNNNLPYWFAEGLATYVDGSADGEMPSVTLDDLAGQNIENITDAGMIRQFYIDSGRYMTGLIQRKGIEEVIKLLGEMGAYPENLQDTGSSMESSNRIFEEIVTEDYGLDTRKFGELLLK